MAERWPGGVRWVLDDGPHPHEAHYLKLDSSRARARSAGARCGTSTRRSTRIVEWYLVLRRPAMCALSRCGQIERFQSDAAR